MLGSAAAMTGALAADEPAWVVGFMIAGLTAHPFTLAGLFCTPNDLSSRYAGERGSVYGCVGVWARAIAAEFITPSCLDAQTLA